MAKDNQQDKKPHGMRTGIIVLIILFLVAVLGAWLISNWGTKYSFGNVIVIPIHGTITVSADKGLFSDSVGSDDILDQLSRAERDSTVQAIVLDINSPGGSPVASEEIARAVADSKKPTVAWIRDSGASGAYWVASASDHIVASRMSITGSVGVIGSYLDFADFLNRYNITEERLVAGRYKDLGNPLKTASSAEHDLLQAKIDLMQQYFLDSVQKNRNLTDEQRKEISSGIFYLGIEAKNLSLVDELGGQPEVKAYLEKTLNTTVEFKSYPVKKSFLESIAGLTDNFGFSVGRGMMAEYLVKQNGVSIRT